MVRNVLLPREIDGRLRELLTGLHEEVNGALLYRKQGDNCPIEELFITGAGSFNSGVSSERAGILNEFFRRNLDYQFARFYAYSKEAVEKFEEDFIMCFSRGNVGFSQDGLRHEASMNIMITPTAKVLDRIDTKLLVVPNYQCYKDRNEIVGRSLMAIGEELGV